jgi:hypothetical protein
MLKQPLSNCLHALRRTLRLATLAASCLAAAPTRADDATADTPSDSHSRQTVIVVLGAPGADEYAPQFLAWAERWRQAAEKGAAQFALIGDKGAADEVNDRTRLQQLLAEQAQHADIDLVWLILIGHGSYDGQTAKFNLRGSDVTAEELTAWLAPITAPLALIDCTSASAPLLNVASAANRVVITATKSGYELNFARFGEYLAAAIDDPQADLDKDDQTSLLEAHLTACRGVAEFYESEARLATEHALLDDNGDGLGTPSAWFRGLRATQRAEESAALDGLRAHQIHLVPSDRESQMPREVRRRRDELELSIAALQAEKETLGDDAYYQRLEPLMLELARLYAELDADAGRPQ